MDDLLLRILCSRPAQPAVDSVLEWLRLPTDLARSASPFDAMVARAATADRPAWALATAHQGALRRLFPELDPNEIVAFCVSEDRGPHPRHIHTRLTGPAADSGLLRLDGHKRWATLAPVADRLLVAASRGFEGEHNRLVLLSLPAGRAGITITPLPESRYAPELPHATIRLEGVAVEASEILPGDAYLDAIKPFRVLEDLFGAAAMLSALAWIGTRDAWPSVVVEGCLAAICGLRALASADPSSPATHIALAGVLAEAASAERAAEACLERSAADLRTRFGGRPATPIGASARERRLASAWTAVRSLRAPS